MWIILGTGFLLIGYILLSAALFGRLTEPELLKPNLEEKVLITRVLLFFASFIPFAIAAWCFGF